PATSRPPPSLLARLEPDHGLGAGPRSRRRRSRSRSRTTAPESEPEPDHGAGVGAGHGQLDPPLRQERHFFLSLAAADRRAPATVSRRTSSRGPRWGGGAITATLPFDAPLAVRPLARRRVRWRAHARGPARPRRDRERAEHGVPAGSRRG